MYIIAEMTGGFRAIQICRTDNWYMHKLCVGRTERRIILQVCGRKYMVYSTTSIRTQYPGIATDQLDSLCDEIMGELQCRMLRAEECVDLPKIAGIIEKKHVRYWMETGLLPIKSLETYYGHPLDPAAQQLVAYVHVEMPDIILLDHEPPADVEQEDLPY